MQSAHHIQGTEGRPVGLEQVSEGQFEGVAIRQGLNAMQGRLDGPMVPSSSKILLHSFCHYNYTIKILRSIVTAFVFSGFQMNFYWMTGLVN